MAYYGRLQSSHFLAFVFDTGYRSVSAQLSPGHVCDSNSHCCVAGTHQTDVSTMYTPMPSTDAADRSKAVYLLWHPFYPVLLPFHCIHQFQFHIHPTKHTHVPVSDWLIYATAASLRPHVSALAVTQRPTDENLGIHSVYMDCRYGITLQVSTTEVRLTYKAHYVISDKNFVSQRSAIWTYPA